MPAGGDICLKDWGSGHPVIFQPRLFVELRYVGRPDVRLR
jgi:hypothetical protein